MQAKNVPGNQETVHIPRHSQIFYLYPWKNIIMATFHACLTENECLRPAVRNVFQEATITLFRVYYILRPLIRRNNVQICFKNPTSSNRYVTFCNLAWARCRCVVFITCFRRKIHVLMTEHCILHYRMRWNLFLWWEGYILPQRSSCSPFFDGSITEIQLPLFCSSLPNGLWLLYKCVVSSAILTWSIV